MCGYAAGNGEVYVSAGNTPAGFQHVLESDPIGEGVVVPLLKLVYHIKE